MAVFEQLSQKKVSNAVAVTPNHLESRSFTSSIDKGAALKNMPIQPKLTIGASDDKHEKEADRVAAKVVKQINSPSQPTGIQKKGDNNSSSASEQNVFSQQGAYAYSNRGKRELLVHGLTPIAQQTGTIQRRKLIRSDDTDDQYSVLETAQNMAHTVRHHPGAVARTMAGNLNPFILGRRLNGKRKRFARNRRLNRARKNFRKYSQEAEQ